MKYLAVLLVSLGLSFNVNANTVDSTDSNKSVTAAALIFTTAAIVIMTNDVEPNDQYGPGTKPEDPVEPPPTTSTSTTTTTNTTTTTSS